LEKKARTCRFGLSSLTFHINHVDRLDEISVILAKSALEMRQYRQFVSFEKLASPLGKVTEE
tara:strand:- start:32251 stop:32436 length:186 start_codon:yes stop_codon:yes gene_type:complete